MYIWEIFYSLFGASFYFYFFVLKVERCQVATWTLAQIFTSRCIEKEEEEEKMFAWDHKLALYVVFQIVLNSVALSENAD